MTRSTTADILSLRITGGSLLWIGFRLHGKEEGSNDNIIVPDYANHQNAFSTQYCNRDRTI
ncbi:MAG: hypothetical protein WA364_00765 [Candidatus Nitrosopolaris sp.]